MKLRDLTRIDPELVLIAIPALLLVAAVNFFRRRR